MIRHTRHARTRYQQSSACQKELSREAEEGLRKNDRGMILGSFQAEQIGEDLKELDSRT